MLQHHEGDWEQIICPYETQLFDSRGTCRFGSGLAVSLLQELRVRNGGLPLSLTLHKHKSTSKPTRKHTKGYKYPLNSDNLVSNTVCVRDPGHVLGLAGARHKQ